MENKIVPSNRVSQVKEYYFSKKLKEVALLNAKGMNIISLGIGGPDRPPHTSVIDALCDDANKSDSHGYQPYVGLPALRQAYADWYKRWYGVELNPANEIQPLIGSKEGILHITLAFINPGKFAVKKTWFHSLSTSSRCANILYKNKFIAENRLKQISLFRKGNLLQGNVLASLCPDYHRVFLLSERKVGE